MTSAAQARQARIAAIEEQIEGLHATIESCRKAVIAARLAIAAGTATLAAWIIGLAGLRDLSALVFALALILGGIVWFGTNQASRKVARAAIAAAERTRAELIQALPLHLIEGR
jgi:Flp pilus assembly protein TadB